MTQPLMYHLIEAKRSVRKLYTEALVGRGDITSDDADAALRDYQQQLERVFLETREALKAGSEAAKDQQTEDAKSAESDTGLEPPIAQAGDAPPRGSATETAISSDALAHLGKAFTNVPAGFTVHPKLLQAMEKRSQSITDGTIDWGTGELIAFGSLLMDGTPVRL